MGQIVHGKSGIIHLVNLENNSKEVIIEDEYDEIAPIPGRLIHTQILKK